MVVPNVVPQIAILEASGQSVLADLFGSAEAVEVECEIRFELGRRIPFHTSHHLLVRVPRYEVSQLPPVKVGAFAPPMRR